MTYSHIDTRSVRIGGKAEAQIHTRLFENLQVALFRLCTLVQELLIQALLCLQV